jgi:hypothetical protein
VPLTIADCCAHLKHTSVEASSCRVKIIPSSALTSRGIGPPSTPCIGRGDVVTRGEPRRNGTSEATTKAIVPMRNIMGAFRPNNDDSAWPVGAVTPEDD